MESFAVVGTGSSLRGIALAFEAHVTVIAVNGAIDLLPRTDIWFTLDPSRANCAIMARPRPGVKYYAAGPQNFALRYRHVTWLTRIEGEGHGHLRTMKGLCLTPGSVHTGNSAWGAFQLAVQLGARRIGLFGIDGAGPYAYGGAPRDLSMLPELFASAVDELKRLDIGVINGSLNSTVTCFPRTTPRRAERWLNWQPASLAGST